MKKIKKGLILLLIIVSFSICFTGCNNEKKEDNYYIQIAKTDIVNLLNENNIEFETISSELWFSKNNKKWYYILIEFNNMSTYKQIFNDLKLVNSLYKVDEESTKADIYYEIVGLYNDKKHNLDSSSQKYGYINELTCDYRIVYNDIAEKNGIGLNIEEKATIYGTYKAYLDIKNKDGTYKYTYNEVREKIANEFNITTSYIITEIDCYEVWTEYWKGFNK